MQKKQLIHNPEKILVVRLSSIGDIILTSPLLRLLRRQFPDAQLDFVVKKRFQELLHTNPHVNNIITLDDTAGFPEMKRVRQQLRRQHYDLILDLHKNFRTAFLLSGIDRKRVRKFKKYVFRRFLLVNFKYNTYQKIIPVYRRYIDAATNLGIQDDHQGLEFFLEPSVCQHVHKILINNSLTGHQLVIGVAPGAGYQTKRWLPGRFAELVRRLQQELTVTILILGGQQDQEISLEIQSQLNEPAIDLCGKLAIMQSACALNYCDLLITNDTGLMHLGAALGKKIIAIFGATVEEFGFFPAGNQSRVIQRDLPCRPCSHMGSRRCPEKHFRCMKDIQVQDVFKVVMEMIAN